MKITKSELKELIQEELKIISEQQSEADRQVQAALEKAANLQADKDKYGDRPQSLDLLTDIKKLMQQLVQKP